MSWLTLNITGIRELVPYLRRIADALERIAPLPDDSAASLKPEEAVSYASDESLTRQHEIDELGEDARRLEDWLREHPEERETLEADLKHE